MADCVRHGYSGGPGVCKLCQEEDQSGLEPGALPGFDNALAVAAAQGPDHHPDPLVRTPPKSS